MDNLGSGCFGITPALRERYIRVQAQFLVVYSMASKISEFISFSRHTNRKA